MSNRSTSRENALRVLKGALPEKVVRRHPKGWMRRRTVGANARAPALALRRQDTRMDLNSVRTREQNRASLDFGA